MYRVEAAFEFAGEEVLNHRIENGLRFHHCGGVAKGWLDSRGVSQANSGQVSKLDNYET